MGNKHLKDLKREAKKKLEKKILEEKLRLKRDEEVKAEAAKRLEIEKKAMILAYKSLPTKTIINYIADRNGCGYYRCIWPFELLATYKNVFSLHSFIYTFEDDILRTTKALRFQRQATKEQRTVWDKYLDLREKHDYKYELHYEIDDLLMEILPHNKVAYDFFDEEKKANHMYMLRTADRITFSTEKLKQVYIDDYGLDQSKIYVVKNTVPQFLYNLPIRSEPGNFSKEAKKALTITGVNPETNQPIYAEREIPAHKPRIFWSGSGSHVGKGGDLEFLIPMIQKTVDEYQWVFQGVIPEELVPLAKEGKIEFLPWCPTYGLSNVQFYRARPDICLAPLTPCKFNTCKSDLKLLECSAMGTPVITTSFDNFNVGKSPYQDTAEICIEPDADIWKSMIDYLVSNPEYFMKTVHNQYRHLNTRWMENNLDTWMTAVGIDEDYFKE